MMTDEDKLEKEKSKTATTRFPGVRKELPPLKRMTKKEIAIEAEERRERIEELKK